MEYYVLLKLDWLSCDAVATDCGNYGDDDLFLVRVMARVPHFFFLILKTIVITEGSGKFGCYCGYALGFKTLQLSGLRRF